jgi:5-bromo-4-chloroindolyl phosphate hydrolysis protein
MDTLKKNAANLLKVKTIVTIVVIAVFSVLALNGSIAPDDVKDIVYMVIAFYFGTQMEKKE